MKIFLSNYRNHWLSPYTICEKVCFWREVDYNEPWVRVVNTALEPLMTLRMKFLDLVHPKIDYVKIDHWDTWSMDSTLSPIILPMLKQIKEQAHGYPTAINEEDLPKELRYTNESNYFEQQTFDFYHEDDTVDNDFGMKQWNWILDEMIFAFEQLAKDDWEEEFYSGETDYQWKKLDNGLTEMFKGPNHTYKWDKEGYDKVNLRIENGLRLFGAYYRSLWT